MSILKAGASLVGAFAVAAAVATPLTVGLFLAVQKRLTSRFPSGFVKH